MKKTPHEKNCKFCNHPKRNEIEHDFINWIPIVELVLKYPELSDQNIQNHLRANPELRKRRSDNLDGAIDKIIERGMIKTMKIDGNTVVRAIQLKLQKSGQLSKDTTVNVNLTIEQIQEKREKNLKEGLNRFGYLTANN